MGLNFQFERNQPIVNLVCDLLKSLEALVLNHVNICLALSLNNFTCGLSKTVFVFPLL